MKLELGFKSDDIFFYFFAAYIRKKIPVSTFNNNLHPTCCPWTCCHCFPLLLAAALTNGINNSSYRRSQPMSTGNVKTIKFISFCELDMQSKFTVRLVLFFYHVISFWDNKRFCCSLIFFCGILVSERLIFRCTKSLI